MEQVRHSLAIDLAEHFQSASNNRRVPRRHWERFPSRLSANVDQALGLLATHGSRATFFVDEWIAERHRAVVARIAEAGHEIAARPLCAEALDQTISDLEGATGLAVQGLKAAQDATPEPDRLAATELKYALGVAVPGLLTFRASGYRECGEWLRLIPEALVPAFLDSWMHSTASRVFSFALWELDPGTPKLAIHTGARRFRTYQNLDLFADRFERLLSVTRFGTLGHGLGLAEVPSMRRCEAPAAAERKFDTGPLREPVSIVVPCFNEEPGLAYLRNALALLDTGFGRRHSLSYVLVDDGSSDGTWDGMQRLFGNEKNVRLVRHPENRGIGAAIRTGLAAAETEIVAVMDSDCSYDPARLEDMLPLLEPDVALVTASPYHPDGGVEGVPEWRLVLSRSASRLYRTVLRNKLATYTSCFRIIRKRAVSELEQKHSGYIGVVEMLARADHEGWRVAEHPVVLEARLLGHSKLKIVGVIADHLGFISEILTWKFSARGTSRSGEGREVSESQ